jgi:hypothetical protein
MPLWHLKLSSFSSLTSEKAWSSSPPLKSLSTTNITPAEICTKKFVDQQNQPDRKHLPAMVPTPHHRLSLQAIAISNKAGLRLQNTCRYARNDDDGSAQLAWCPAKFTSIAGTVPRPAQEPSERVEAADRLEQKQRLSLVARNRRAPRRPVVGTPGLK